MCGSDAGVCSLTEPTGWISSLSPDAAPDSRNDLLARTRTSPRLFGEVRSIHGWAPLRYRTPHHPVSTRLWGGRFHSAARQLLYLRSLSAKAFHSPIYAMHTCSNAVRPRQSHQVLTQWAISPSLPWICRHIAVAHCFSYWPELKAEKCLQTRGRSFITSSVGFEWIFLHDFNWTKNCSIK